MKIREIVVSVVDGCRRHAVAVVLACLAATGLLGYYVATHLGIDTDQRHLVDAELPWRQTELALDLAFPQGRDDLVILVEGQTPQLADQGAARLAERLAARPDLFRIVSRPDALPFFRRNGLLFLKPDELRRLADRMIQAQPLIGALAADPSGRGLFRTLSLFLEGVQRGEAALADLEPALALIAETAESVADGRPRPPAWQALFTGRAVEAGDLRRFILTQPVLDYGALSAGAAASAFAREAARELGLTPETGYRVRLTGSVALADEEFASVGHGAEFALLFTVVLVTLELWLALRSARLILPILATIFVGLTATAAFAVATYGDLNLISVAFAVLFVGLAVDFSIQFCVRFRDERHRHSNMAEALRRCAGGIGVPLLLAAATTMVGFFSFVPTAYVGVSELGVIAGVGMVIAIVLNLTLLPALLSVARPPGEREPAGYAWLAGPDRFLARRSGWVLLALVVIVAAALVVAPRLTFDFNPLNLKDKRTESVATLLDLINDPTSTPYTAKVLTPSIADADALAARLDVLPEVGSTVTASSFVPKGQEEKLVIIQDAAMLLGPSLAPPEVAPPPSAAETAAAMRDTAERLEALGGEAPGATTARRLAAALDRVLAAGPEAATRLGDVLVSGAVQEVAMLGEALQAGPVTLADLPEELRRDWVAADGRAVIRIAPRGDARENATLVSFVSAVQKMAPGATGLPVGIQEMGHTVVDAFRTAVLLALAAIVALLGVILRRPVDVLLTLVPVLLGGLFTAATCVLIGLPITFANVIVLPLLLGIGVAYGVYYVMNWRSGVTEPLQSSMTRAVLFSALTTGTSFGSLALSEHPGTSGMGELLSISLAYTVLASMVFLPAALAWLGRRRPPPVPVRP